MAKPLCKRSCASLKEGLARLKKTKGNGSDNPRPVIWCCCGIPVLLCSPSSWFDVEARCWKLGVVYHRGNEGETIRAFEGTLAGLSLHYDLIYPLAVGRHAQHIPCSMLLAARQDLREPRRDYCIWLPDFCKHVIK